MSDRINYILSILEIVAKNYEHSHGLTDIEGLRRDADKIVAKRHGIGWHAVQDKYRRQLEPFLLGTLAFDKLIYEWLAQGSTELYEILLQRVVDKEDEENVQEFFAKKYSVNTQSTPIAVDIEEPTSTQRSKTEVYRILRDTALARRIKSLYQNKCQLCGATVELANGEQYSEAHHIKPLGSPHNGPDLAGNIIVVCPNHHVALDYGAMSLNKKDIVLVQGHEIGTEFIEYHNNNILK